MKAPLSSVKEILWPALPPLSAARKLAIQFQLNQSQWWNSDELFEHQLDQLAKVLYHAYNTVPFYREFYQSQRYRPKQLLTDKLFSNIPILTRAHVQAAADKFISNKIPPHHGKVLDVSTSGSTGKTIKIKSTELSQFFWNAFTFRDHLWHKRDVSKKLAIIRITSGKHALPPNGITMNSWGDSTHEIKKPGKAVLLSVKSTIDEQWEWLKRQDPDSLLTYPSTLNELVKRSLKDAFRFSGLCSISTLGEIITDDIRKNVMDAWGLPVKDIYSCQEAGYLALQCPQTDNYHVQSENIILEVLNERNQPCAAGETGRVVITTLNNFASPLIRYDIGDYAEVSEPCRCGRGLPTLKRIVGRVRNLITYPDGSKAWPVVGSDRYNEICNIKQFQFIQKTVSDIELKLVIDERLTTEQEEQLKSIIHESLRYPFNIEFTYHDNIPRSKGGKFEDFMSLL